jgi:hypothetical protein
VTAGTPFRLLRDQIGRRGSAVTEKQTMSQSTSTVILEPPPPGGTIGPVVASGKGEHVFNAVNRIMEEQLKSWLEDAGKANGGLKDAALAAIGAWRDAAAEFAKKRDDSKFHVADKGDPMNSARYSRMKNELETAAREMAEGTPGGMTHGYTTFNRRLNDIVLVDVTAPASVKSALSHSVDYTAAEEVLKSVKKGKEADFDEWFEKTSGLMYTTLVNLRDAALAVGRARRGG